MCAADRECGGCREEVVFGQGLHQSRLVVLGLFVQVMLSSLQKCHGSTGSPSALSEEDSKGGVTVLEGSKVLARGTRSCT